MTSVKTAPSETQAGTMRWLLPPRSMRAMWGISRPIQPILPHIDTQDAVIAVAAKITARRMARKLTPMERASSSLRARMLSRQRSR